MKVLILLFLSAVTIPSAAAQTNPPTQAPPDVVISNFDFGTLTFVFKDRETLSGYAAKVPSVAENRREPNRGLSRDTPYRNQLSSRYATLEVINRGTKTVKAIEWDFAYPRVVNQRAVPRHAARTKVKIEPGEIKTLRASLPKYRRPRCGPVVIIGGVVQPSSSGNKDCDLLNSMAVNPQQERVSLKRIEYADGSVWQRL